MPPLSFCKDSVCKGLCPPLGFYRHSVCKRLFPPQVFTKILYVKGYAPLYENTGILHGIEAIPPLGKHEDSVW